MHFEIHQRLHTVPLSEAINGIGAVLMYPAHKVVGDADIKRPAFARREDVNVVGQVWIIACCGIPDQVRDDIEVCALTIVKFAAPPLCPPYLTA